MHKTNNARLAMAMMAAALGQTSVIYVGSNAQLEDELGPPSQSWRRKQICCNPLCRATHRTGKAYCSVECCKAHRAQPNGDQSAP